MNTYIGIGRLTRDPAITYTQAGMCIARFSIAINRGKDKDGKDKGADYPSIVCFGKTAELVDKYVTKGRKIAVMGRIQTGSYEKDGRKIYTTDVIADKVEFLEPREEPVKTDEPMRPAENIYEHYEMMPDSDLPF